MKTEFALAQEKKELENSISFMATQPYGYLDVETFEKRIEEIEEILNGGTATLKIGSKYKNAYGAVFEIIDFNGSFFVSNNDDRYHADGCFMQINGNPKFNLVEEVLTDRQHNYVEFLREAENYFSKRPTGGEDSAHWSNVYNAENCKRIAEYIDASLPALEIAVASNDLDQVVADLCRAAIAKATVQS